MRRVIVTLLLAWPTIARADTSTHAVETPRVESTPAVSDARRTELGAGVEMVGRDLPGSHFVFGAALFGEVALPSTFGARFFRPSMRLGVQYLENMDGGIEIASGPLGGGGTSVRRPGDEKGFLTHVELCPFGARTTFEGSFNVGLSVCGIGHVGEQGFQGSSFFWMDGGALGRVYLEIGARSQARFVVGMNVATLWRIVGAERFGYDDHPVMPKVGIEAGVLFP